MGRAYFEVTPAESLCRWVRWNVYCRLRRHTLCRLEVLEWRRAPNGERPNFCGCCNMLLKPDSFQHYGVLFKDGEQVRVEAVNWQHALNLVTAGPDACWAQRGGEWELQSPFLRHPANVCTVRRAEDPAGAAGTDR
ncbi:MAG: hypothetical protein ISP90_00375 [Nevskia sp.]|nr:hypothetical protein [Nevskia sp.]